MQNEARSLTLTHEQFLLVTLLAKLAITAALATLGTLGLMLASVGLYATIAFAVTRRSREIGIRLALGAGRADVFGVVLRQGLAPALSGLGAGLAGAVVLTRFLSSLLFETAPLDPATYAAGIPPAEAVREI